MKIDLKGLFMILALLLSLLILNLLISCKYCKNTEAICNNDTIYVVDTIYDNTEILKYQNIIDEYSIENSVLRDSLELVIYQYDSLNIVKDSLLNDYEQALYIIERVRYYNNAAAKGNNIKYLRGWIRRALGD